MKLYKRVTWYTAWDRRIEVVSSNDPKSWRHGEYTSHMQAPVQGRAPLTQNGNKKVGYITQFFILTLSYITFGLWKESKFIDERMHPHQRYPWWWHGWQPSMSSVDQVLMVGGVRFDRGCLWYCRRWRPCWSHPAWCNCTETPGSWRSPGSHPGPGSPRAQHLHWRAEITRLH